MPFLYPPLYVAIFCKKKNWRITFTRIIKLYAIALKLPTVYFLPAVKIFFLHSFYEKFNFQCFVSMFVLFRFCFSWLTLKSFHNLFENVHIFCSNNIFIFSGTLCILPGFPKQTILTQNSICFCLLKVNLFFDAAIDTVKVFGILLSETTRKDGTVIVIQIKQNKTLLLGDSLSSYRSVCK